MAKGFLGGKGFFPLHFHIRDIIKEIGAGTQGRNMAQAGSPPLLLMSFGSCPICKILGSLQLGCTFTDSLSWTLLRDLTLLFDVKLQLLSRTPRAPTEMEAVLYLSHSLSWPLTVASLSSLHDPFVSSKPAAPG